MLKNYDLHSHSTASDGTLTPTELVEYAASKGVEVLALTDHDTTDGIIEAQAAANKVGIRLITGVEISVSWQNLTIHLVGLGYNINNSDLQNGLKTLRDFRQYRAKEIARRLEKHGIIGAYEGAKNHSKGNLIARPHFAQFLIEKGHAKDFSQAFKKFLTPNKPGYVSGEWATLEHAVKWIKEANGQIIIAHPARYNMTRTKLRRLIDQFKAVGGDGIEVVSGSHSKEDVFKIKQHALDFQLLASAGSDYHGPEHRYIDMGKLSPLPESCTPIWKDWD